MESDDESTPFYDTNSVSESNSVSNEPLIPNPFTASEPALDEIELSPTYHTPTPYRSKLRPRLNTTGYRDVTVLEIKARSRTVYRR
jgi:hypothetical protein